MSTPPSQPQHQPAPPPQAPPPQASGVGTQQAGGSGREVVGWSRWAELGLYAAVALFAVSRALPTGMVVGDGVDLYGTFWFYWWIQHCLQTLTDPSFTDLMFYPLGKDIFAHTGNNFVDALLAAPLQALRGFPDYQPWWIALLLLGNALTFRPLARDLLRHRGSVIASTVLWQISPYLLFEVMAGRPTQALAWFLPLAVRHFLHIGGVDASAALPGARPHGARWGDPLLAGLYTGLAAWTYWFMGYFMALLFAWLALVDLWRRRDRAARLAGYGVAAVTAVGIVAPGVWAMAQAASLGDVPGVQFGAAGTLDAPALLANNVAQHLHGYWLMETQGQPLFGYVVWGGLLAVAALVAADRWRWVGAWLLIMAFALGPAVPIGRGIPMPHYLLAYHWLPFFDRLWFPVRMVVVAMLAASVLLGMLLDRLEGLRRSVSSWLPAALVPVMVVGLGMVEQHRVLAFPIIARDLTPPVVYEVIGELGGGLIELPIGMARVSIAWQAVHEQPTFGGMAENAPVFYPAGFKRRLANSFIVYLRRATREPDRELSYDQAALDRLVAEGFRWVVLDRQLVDSEIMNTSFARRVPAKQSDRAPFYLTDNITEHLGAPVMAEERLVVWDLVGGAEVPPELVPTEADLTERSWPKKEMPEYEAWMRERGRLKKMGSSGDKEAPQGKKSGRGMKQGSRPLGRPPPKHGDGQ